MLAVAAGEGMAGSGASAEHARTLGQDLPANGDQRRHSANPGSHGGDGRRPGNPQRR